MTQMNNTGSTVFLMIETIEGLERVDDIAAEPGCDVLLVGSQDLSTELGTLDNWDDPKFMGALQKVGAAAAKHGKIFGIAGLYTRPDILKTVIQDYGARWVLGANDVALLTAAAKDNNALIRSLE